MYQYPSWLVETKLRPNTGPVRRIERAHIQRLLEADAAQVILLHAPPGYGKTSAMTQLHDMVVGAGETAAWLSLDEDDQDPQRLFYYLVASLKHAGCDIDYVLPPHPQDLAHSSLNFLTDTVVNALAQTSKPLCIFLDDFHRAENEQTSQIIKRLVSGLVKSRVVIAARYRPTKIDAAELRATGRLLEIEKEDLQFSPSDIEHYFGDRLKVEKRAQYCHALAQRTEGWPIALQAIRQLIAKGSSANDALEQTSGRSSFLTDYFIEQVFETLPAEHQNLLLRTAICERVNGDLADMICGTEDAWEILESLESSDTFIESLDADRQWYRYHRLFAEFLIERARRDRSIDIAGSASRASRWYRDNHYAAEALQFAIMTEDPRFVAETLAALGGWRQALMGNLPNVVKALECMPDEIIRQHPTVWMADIYAKLKVGDYEAADEGHRVLRQTFTKTIERDMLIRKDVALVDSLVVGYRDQHERLSEMIDRLESLDAASLEEDQYFIANKHNTLSFFHFRLGAFDRAHAYAEKSIVSYQKAGSLYGEAFVYFHQCFTYYLEGRLRDAKAMLHQGLELSGSQFGLESDLYAIGAAYASLIYYDSNDLAKARSYLKIALPKIERSDAWTEVYLAAYAAGMMTAAADEEWALFDHILNSANALSRNRQLPRVGAFAQLFAQAQNEKYATAHDACAINGGYQEQHCTLTRFDDFHAIAAKARHLIHQKRHREALHVLESHREWARRKHLYRPFMTLALLSAIASKALGNDAAADQYFNDALAPALFEDYKRPFIDEGPGVVELINRASGHTDQHGHNRLRDRFLAAIIAEINAGTQAPAPTQTVLSSREIDVLRSLVQGRTNQEISEVLGISRNTVKFHLKNVFEKLNVTSRQDALRLCLRDNLM